MTRTEQALKLTKTLGLVRPKDLAHYGIAPVYLRRLLHTGELVQSVRGVYKLPDHRATPHHHLAQACKRIPGGVVCLQSALHFHGLIKQRPSQIWMAIDRKARLPSVGDLPIRFVRFSGAALREGVEEHPIEGVPLRVTSCAKTVVDLFEYRNKLGLTLALDALRDCLRRQKCPVDELWGFAIVCRVETVIRPYLEALA